MKFLQYIKGVSTLTYDESLCIGCRNCLDVCPHEVFGFSDGKAVLRDRDSCMECGACVLNCPAGALTVDKGVGCAAAVIESRIREREEISCGCDDSCNSGSGGCCG